jgi:hypothetical protein
MPRSLPRGAVEVEKFQAVRGLFDASQARPDTDSNGMANPERTHLPTLSNLEQSRPGVQGSCPSPSERRSARGDTDSADETAHQAGTSIARPRTGNFGPAQERREGNLR